MSTTESFIVIAPISTNIPSFTLFCLSYRTRHLSPLQGMVTSMSRSSCFRRDTATRLFNPVQLMMSTRRRFRRPRRSWSKWLAYTNVRSEHREVATPQMPSKTPAILYLPLHPNTSKSSSASFFGTRRSSLLSAPRSNFGRRHHTADQWQEAGRHLPTG